MHTAQRTFTIKQQYKIPATHITTQKSPKQDLNALLQRFDAFRQQQTQKEQVLLNGGYALENGSNQKIYPDDNSSTSYSHCFQQPDLPTKSNYLKIEESLKTLLEKRQFRACTELLHNLAAKRQITLDHYNLVLRQLCKNNRIQDVTFLLSKIEHFTGETPTQSTYNLCLENLSTSVYRVMLQLFQTMIDNNMHASPKTCVKIVKIAQMQRDETLILKVMKLLRSFAHSQEIHKYAVVYEEIIHALTALGRTGKLENCLQQMRIVGITITTSSFNSILLGLMISQGHESSFLELLQQMKSEKIPFNTRTYEIIISYFTLKRDDENVFKYFDEYKSSKNPPSTQMCTTLLKYLADTHSNWDHIWNTFKYMKKYNTLLELEQFPQVLLLAPHVNYVNEIAEYQCRRGKLDVLSLLGTLNSMHLIQTSVECLQHLVLNPRGPYHLDVQIVAAWLTSLPPLEEPSSSLARTLLSKLHSTGSDTLSRQQMLSIPRTIFQENDWKLVLELLRCLQSQCFLQTDDFMSVTQFAKQ